MKQEGEDVSAAKAEGLNPGKLHPAAECCCSSFGSRTSCPAAPPCGCRRPQGEKTKTNVDRSVTESKAGDIVVLFFCFFLRLVVNCLGPSSWYLTPSELWRSYYGKIQVTKSPVSLIHCSHYMSLHVSRGHMGWGMKWNKSQRQIIISWGRVNRWLKCCLFVL